MHLCSYLDTSCRHANRQLLLRRLEDVRKSIRDLESEVQNIEGTLQGLPYTKATDVTSVQQPQFDVANARYCFTANAIGGAVGLPLAFAAVHPLDTVRTCMQAAVKGDVGFGQAVSQLGSRAFTRGFGASVLWACPQGAIRLGCYGSCKGYLYDNFEFKPLCAGVSAICADLASSAVKVPRELITQQMQTGQYPSQIEAVKDIVRREGPVGLFRGYLSTCARDAPFMVILFVSYDAFKSWKLRLTTVHAGPGHVLNDWSDLETIVWGGFSGGMAGFFTTPFDVLKTRIMTAPENVSITKTLSGMKPSDFVIGAAPRSAWWFCVCSVFFATFERVRSAVQERIDAR
jgi:hypothetical protein